jgi:hypothetical protein
VIQLILFLLVGALLFVSLLFLARRAPRAEGGGQALAEARQALNSLQLGLLPPELVGRIFAKDDLEYVVSETPERIRALFLGERKKIVLSWVGQVRRQIVSLRRFHLGAARFYSRLSFRTEMMLALDFAGLLMACRALQVLVYLRGPHAAPRMIGITAATAARVCEISEKSLAFLNAAYPNQFGDRSAGPMAL